jgi:hypothetical protein
MGVALALFLLSPVTLLAWAVGQAFLRITGMRWWKLALASLAAIGLVVLIDGGPGPALAHHFSGYVGWLRQIGAAQLDYPAPGAFLWPQLALAIPVGLLAAALNLAGRRQAIDPAEVKRQQRDATRRIESAVKRAAQLRDDHFGPVALGVQVDGDLGWTDKRRLVVVPRAMQNRSRLIVGTSGTGKTTDIEREGFAAARDGRKFFLIDGKGTDPGFVERALAGYLWGNLWPTSSARRPGAQDGPKRPRPHPPGAQGRGALGLRRPQRGRRRRPAEGQARRTPGLEPRPATRLPGPCRG